MVCFNGNKRAHTNKSKFLQNRRFMDLFALLLLLLEMWLATSVRNCICMWYDCPNENIRKIVHLHLFIAHMRIPTKVDQYRVIHLHHPNPNILWNPSANAINLISWQFQNQYQLYIPFESRCSFQFYFHVHCSM